MPARADASARRRARYPIPAESDDVADRLAQQVLAMTIADEGPDVNSQASRLWMPRAQFQMARPSLEPASNTTISSAIMDTFRRTSAAMPPPAAQRSVPPTLHPIPSTPTTTASSKTIPGPPSPPRFRPCEEQECPSRRPRRTAAQKAIEDQLKAAALVHEDLRLCEEKTRQQPTLQLYYELRHDITNITTSIELLNRRDE